MRHRLRLLVLPVVLAAGLGVTASGPSQAEVPAPTLTAPPDGLYGHALWDSYYQLEPFGYEEEEYLVSGTAVDAAGTPAAYTTRMIVTRPSDPADFNGTVLLDWVNVTAQFENAVDTMLAREMLMREGFAYVHVSAQAAGICCFPGLTPATWDPERYAALDHPGDEWAFDMFTQVARSFEAPNAAPGSLDPRGALAGHVERILAAGQSQSANQLADYISTWLPAHPEAAGVIDGILVHGNVPGVKDFAAASPVPVLQLLSDYEAEADGVDPATLGPNHRLWEIAGAAHADHFIGYQSVAGHGPRVLTHAPKISEADFRDVIDAAGNYGEVVTPTLATCVVAGATMPMHYATSTAIHQLDAWVAGGSPPANGPRFQFDGDARAEDADGNTLGGIRLPPIDVPVATYESTTCQLGGVTIFFTDAEIQARYGTHAEYYRLMAERTDAAVRAGWLLPVDAVDLMRRVCRASVRFGTPGAPCATYVPPPFNQVLGSETVAPAPAPTPAPAPARRSGLPATGGEAGVLPFALLAAGLLVRRRL
jgi:hypothetical protein